MGNGLVLSVFPGIDLLGRAFEEEGYCVVRGPDLLWGGDVRTFHPPSGVFEGVIGGPPCQAFSRLVNIVKAKGQTPKPNLIPEFERVIDEAQPLWFLMENVPAAPVPQVKGYWPAYGTVLNNRWLGERQHRERRFSFATRFDVTESGVSLDVSTEIVIFEHPEWERAVMATSSKEGALAKSQQELRDGASRRMSRAVSAMPGQKPRRTVERCAELQGLPPTFLKDAPFTASGKYLAIGNGVPLPMGRAIARAVRRALAALRAGQAGT